jgi:hypothetical protein
MSMPNKPLQATAKSTPRLSRGVSPLQLLILAEVQDWHTLGERLQ